MSNAYDTTSAVLGDNLKPNGILQIQTGEGMTSTNGFQPKGIKPGGKSNPVPAKGFAKVSTPETAEFAASSAVKAILLDDGRFAQPEIIIGTDDRTRVNNTTAWPYRVHGHMIIRFPNNKQYIGSGTMVNRHHVLTAGHCVFSAGDGGWATSIAFVAAQNDASMPFGTVFATRLLSVVGWTQNNDRAWDFGMLILASELGPRTGWFGVITYDESGPLLRKRVNVSGYPGDKGGQQMWTHADAIKSVTPENFYYDIDTVGGQSGSGVWSLFDGHQGEKVAGIHTTGATTGNGATRVSRVKFNRILDWFQNY